MEKKQAEIETYKLKVVELRLWKKKWQSRIRNNELKKRKRKEKLDKRRKWIKEQIEKGYMHKSCTILVHSRAKFPFEPGFEPVKKRGIKKSDLENNPENMSPFIKGMKYDHFKFCLLLYYISHSFLVFFTNYKVWQVLT